MTIFARLAPADQNGDRHVLEIADAPDAASLAERFHPTIASQFITAPNATLPGSIKNGATWTHRDPVEEEETEVAALPRLLQVSPPTFLLLFTPQERIAIRAARNYAGADAPMLMIKAVLDDWFSIVDDPRLQYVDLALQATKDGLAFLVSVALLTEERRSEILIGVAA